MRTFIQSLIVSFLIHLIYIGGSFVKGYIETWIHQPKLDNQLENIDFLQSEVAFGVSASYMFFIISFILVTLLCYLIIISYKKFFAVQ